MLSHFETGGALAAQVSTPLSEVALLKRMLEGGGLGIEPISDSPIPGLVCHQIKNGGGEPFPRIELATMLDRVVGALCRFDETRHLFVLRDPKTDSGGVADAIRTLHKGRHALELNNGGVEWVQSEVRQRLRTLTETTPALQAGPSEPPIFTVGQWSNERIQTLASQDDSYEKAIWRSRGQRLGWTIFPNGRASIPDDEGLVMMFPGDISDAKAPVKEFLSWSELGFIAPDDFIFLEKNPRVRGRLARNSLYSDIPIVGRTFGQTGYKTGKKPSTRVISEARNKGRAYSVLSFDPNNNLSRSFIDEIGWVLRYGKIGKEAWVGVNFSADRVDVKKIPLYEEMAGGSLAEMFHGNIDALREAAIRNVIPSVIPAGMGEVSQHTLSGSYQGNSGNTRMFYAMHHLTSNPYKWR
jgi:hypothetical protein